MSLDELPDPEIMWAGKYLRAVRRAHWEYVSRTNNIRAVVILAEYEGRIILVEQPRVPIGERCLELPAGLVGDVDADATVEGTAIKELEEETGFTATHVERLGEFYSSPGILAEGFTLVRAHGLRKIGEGGGDENEEIVVHLVPRDAVPNFIEEKRAEGVGIDVKLLIFADY